MEKEGRKKGLRKAINGRRNMARKGIERATNRRRMARKSRKRK